MPQVDKSCETVALTSLAQVQKLQPRKSGGQKYYMDAKLTGFGVCVGARSKTFFVQRHVKGEGKRVRVTLGRVEYYEELKKAKSEAQDLLARMSRGENPNATARITEGERVTLREGLEMYISTLETLGKSPASIRGARAAVEKYLKGWLDKRLVDITPDMAERRHKKIVSEIAQGKHAVVTTSTGKVSRRPRKEGDGRYAANAAMRNFRAIYGRVQKAYPRVEKLAYNPAKNVTWFPAKSRDAAIPADQLALWYRDVMNIGNPIRRDLLRLILFTGLRRESAASIEWADVDLDNKTLFIPRPKGGKAFHLPLSDFLVELLQERLEQNELLYPNSRYVFPADSKSGRIAEPKTKLSVPFSVHGLRHTFISVAESIDCSVYAIKRLVNHTTGGGNGDVTAGYVRHDVERLRAPMQRITDRLLALCTPSDGKVVELPQRAVDGG